MYLSLLSINFVFASLIGLANVYIVTDCMTLTRAQIEVNIPRKRKRSCSDHDKVCMLSSYNPNLVTLQSYVMLSL